MTVHIFKFPLERIEVVILTKKRIPTLRPIWIGDRVDTIVRHVKDELLLQVAAGVSALSRLMANAGGPTSNRRRLLIAEQLVLLFGEEVRADGLYMEPPRERLTQVERRRAFLFARAVMVIVGVVSDGLLAKEYKAMYKRNEENSTELIAPNEHKRALNEWQLYGVEGWVLFD